MADENQLPEWHAPGIEPPEQKKKEGWLVTEKPPADWFNWLFHRIYRTFVRYEEKFKDIYEKFTNHLGKGGSTHPNATQTISGFLSGPDKKKLDEQVVLNTGGTITGDVKIDAGLTVRLKVKKSGKDSNGKFTTVEWRRKKDNTLFMRSVLSSPDINGNYQTDTWSIYNAAGTAVIETVTWPLTYDADGDFVESS